MTTANACTCPSCQSREWKLAGLVHAEGAYAVNLQSSGTGVSVGGAGLNVGATSTATQGTNISALAQRAAPPTNNIAELGTGSGMLGAIICGTYGYFSGDFFAMIFFIIIGAIGGMLVGMLYFWKSSHAQYAEAMERYQKVRMCTRCGHFYTPDASA